jgi:hypothetical protein
MRGHRRAAAPVEEPAVLTLLGILTSTPAEQDELIR